MATLILYYKLVTSEPKLVGIKDFVSYVQR